VKEGNDTSSGRIIPPEAFGKYENQSQQEQELSQDALIEKLRADSASMRIRFEEKVRELKSDSQTMREKISQLQSDSSAMREKIQKLTKKVNELEKKLNEEGSGSKTTPSPSMGGPGQDQPRLQPTPQTGPQPPSSMKSESKSSSTTDQDKTQSKEKKDQDKKQEDKKAEQEKDKEGLPEGTRLNPNTASLSELKSIEGLSDRLAERIEWYRREVSPFKDLQDLKRVPGIDRQVFKSIKNFFHEGPY
jgi:competence ComEA-like helix-hairpin-helix protein